MKAVSDSGDKSAGARPMKGPGNERGQRTCNLKYDGYIQWLLQTIGILIRRNGAQDKYGNGFYYALLYYRK
ncbi:hypothetical protein DDT52_14330 [Brenneria roseae subsp. roseae]|nr:hypothetical protein DDT52_14330 [Brenneria roseae subsp. roseae]